ncbi:unnamed protein product [Lymnaea stagnalis]|uniref:IMS import disulfide relay-system CHCH-CHCH-like Cx9C domain-containing protein n=1 Tax=Lymnaea stagnalis TaxID=6523 RepID=A0AAV2HT09_LYMST
MEHSMRLVEKHCSKYLEMFAECIQKYPHTWQMDCELERRKLARCAESNPEILHIKSVCAKQFQVYEKCMSEAASNPEKCTESFQVFSSCAAEALLTFKAAESSSSPNCSKTEESSDSNV